MTTNKLSWNLAFLLIIPLLTMSCDPIEDMDENDEPQVEEVSLMQWEANSELNTTHTDEVSQEHHIYFPQEDCEYVMTCTNYMALHPYNRNIIGNYHVGEDGLPDSNCWLHFDSEAPGYEQSNPDSQDYYCFTPYYKVWIEGNSLKISLKGAEIYSIYCCPLELAVTGDGVSYDVFHFEPEPHLL